MVEWALSLGYREVASIIIAESVEDKQTLFLKACQDGSMGLVDILLGPPGGPSTICTSSTPSSAWPATTHLKSQQHSHSEQFLLMPYF